MKREIKFRAWIPSFCSKEKDYPKIGKMFYFPINFQCYGATLGVKYKTVMQFTGLKDKNGKEIYEGDVITDGSLAWFGANIRYQATIEFKDGCWKQTNSNCDCGECTDAVLFENHKELEVIGNIYENKELLNKETGL